jgi:hypothetical protein
MVADVPVSRVVKAPLSADRFIWPLVSLSIFSLLAKVMSPPAPVLKVIPVVPWTTRLPVAVVVAAFREMPPEPELIVVVLVVLVEPRTTVLTPAPLPMAML